MSDAKYSIEAAKRKTPDWNKHPRSRLIAQAILEDCLDRRGIKHEFYQVDRDTLNNPYDADDTERPPRKLGWKRKSGMPS